MKKHLVLAAVLATSGLPLLGCSSSDPGLCAPVTGNQLTVLTDDKNLQNSENVVAAFNREFADAHPAAVEALDAVAKILDTPMLIELNKAVDLDRKTSSEVAAMFVKEHNLAFSDSSAGAGTTVVVGAANFSENTTLAEVYAAVLDSAGFDASTQTIGSRETYYPALASGEIQVVPEYAASLAEFANGRVNGPDATPVATPDIATTMKALTSLAAKDGLTVGEPSAAQDQNAFAVTTAFAEKHGISTLSELAALCGTDANNGLELAGPPECPERPFCQVGLEETYGLRFSEFKTYDFGLIIPALRNGDATIGVVQSSDGALATD